MAGKFTGAARLIGSAQLLLRLASLCAACTLTAAEHRIEYISILDRETVLIHFNTEPNREYILQSINRLSCVPNSAGCNSRGIPTNWITVITIPPYPDVQHFVVPDSRTAQRRYYRLRIRTP